ncbi:MAG: HAD family phosphatase [Isosphaeraceae bacterium]
MGRPEIAAVAFDLDGLMFNTEALFVRVAGEMLKSRGKVFTPEIMAAMIGRQWAVAGPAFKKMAGLTETLDELLAEKRERFFALLGTAVKPTPGLLNLLDALDRRALPRCVATSSRRDYAMGLLEQHNLLHRFAFILTAEDIERSKPDPEIYRKAVERFGIEPAGMLVLEDSPAGISAAKAAGAFAVAIPHEHSPAEGLVHADRIVPRLDDPSLLEEIRVRSDG